MGETDKAGAEASEARPRGSGVAFAEGALVQDSRTGRFTTGNGLTKKQEKFVALYCKGGSQTEAARLAGYSAPQSQGWRLLRIPQVAAAIRERQAAKLAGLSNVALTTLRDVMEDETAPAAARVSAAKWTLEAAGHGLAASLGAARLGLDRTDKPLSELSLDELEAMARRASAAVEQMRTANAPIIEADSAQVVDAE